MTEESPWLTDPLWDRPEGTIEHLGGPRYLVKGKKGSYAMDADEGVCDCPQHQYRLVSGEDCKHLVRLREHLKVSESDAAAEEMTDDELRALFA